MAAGPESTRSSCFVAMPFGGSWDEYYGGVYAPAIVAAGLTPVRADEVFSAGSILKDIVELLARCQVVLADITDPNRNVHYELGLAHALGKPTVLVAPSDMRLFFDVGQERIVTYNKENAFWGRDLTQEIAAAIRATVADPASAIPTAFMHIKPNRMDVDETTVRLRRIEDMLVELTRQAAGASSTRSRLKTILQGLPQAELDAERLLASKNRDQVVRDLVSSGYGQVMAETAVANAASRMSGDR